MRGTLAALALVIASCATSTPNGGTDIDAQTGTHPDARVGSHPDANNANSPDANTTGGPADANNCSVQPCTLAPQCGCASNQACDVSSTGNVCRADTPSGVVGTTCTADTSCAAGYTCVGDGTNDSCEKYCTSNSDCGSPRGQCVIQLIDQNMNPISGAVMCSSNCDPVAASNPLCPSGWSCDLFNATYPYPNGTTYDISDCRKAGTGLQNTDCSASAACSPAYTCVDYNAASDPNCTTAGDCKCARICGVSPAGGECNGTSTPTCTGFSTAFTVGGKTYGVCQ
jgi:hypothetical protein